MKIAICDDEQVFVEKITRLLREVFPQDKQCTIMPYMDGAKLLQDCESNEINAAILDIAMPGMDGFALAKKLQEKNKDMLLMFVSSKEELVFRSYEYHPFWFVPKSQLITLPDVLQKFVDKLIEREEKNDCIKINFHKTVVEVNLNTLLYFESNRHYLVMVTTEGTQRFREKLTAAEIQLKEHRFVRCHVGYLVNCRKISQIQKNDLILLDGTRIPISRNKMTETKHAFQSYLRSERW